MPASKEDGPFLSFRSSEVGKKRHLTAICILRRSVALARAIYRCTNNVPSRLKRSKDDCPKQFPSMLLNVEGDILRKLAEIEASTYEHYSLDPNDPNYVKNDVGKQKGKQKRKPGQKVQSDKQPDSQMNKIDSCSIRKR
ncbi:hypothetical protein PROFUN_15846 [Planoprotostelium fungivorum]|uniref:Uncharacterized protein n=1 Tax=Planoprotostelium fungivorum TaxID=1890364 RepID=A0A2P6MU96_9EUKA|nr:hypothetical protein PROFUN_15846 [Planoprotostelium fungivorum]